MRHHITGKSEYGKCRVHPDAIEFISDQDEKEAFFSMEIEFPDWEQDCYIMMPGCAYNGNRYLRVKKSYPPMYTPEEAHMNIPLMTDLPALNPDGSGMIQVTSGDMAVPCVGIMYKKKKEAFFLFTEQAVKGENIGFSVSAGKIAISYPANRTEAYRMCDSHAPCEDRGIAVEKGELITGKFAVLQFDCEDIPQFYELFFRNRKCLMHSQRCDNRYTKELWDIMEKRFNTRDWSGVCYARSGKLWDCGWVGGGMYTLALYVLGNAETRKRAVQTIDYLAEHQAGSGLFYGMIKNGEIIDDSFGMPGMENIHLIRRSCDALYFLYKHLKVMPIKRAWVDAAKKCADALVRLFEGYGSFGQFVHIETGEMVVGGSAGGAMGIGALAMSWQYFKDEKYLKIAEKAGEYYYRQFVYQGVTNGGPGEALCAPDSESAFSMLESFVALYEVTEDQKWLEYAKTCANLCSSWVVTYAYKFPENSEFARLNINTVGSIIANVQNKHAAPGIATLSGDSLYKLYKFTGERRYLDLILDIAFFIPQCVYTNKNPISTRGWGNDETLREGEISERVNLSDWEEKQRIGAVCGDCFWPAAALVLSFLELTCYDEFKKQ